MPAAVRQALRLVKGERVLAAACDRSGRWHVATERALHLFAGADQRRVAWPSVDRANWDADKDRLVIIEVADFGEVQPRHDLELTEPGRLLEVVRERVTASVLMTRHVPVAGSRGLKVVARRPPGGDGEVQWSFWLDDGLDPGDPAVQEAVERGLAEARAELGQ